MTILDRQINESSIVESDRDHWSYRPILKSRIPQTKDRTWAKSEIDSFILAKLEASDLKPPAEADRNDLLRRLKLDLLGLPPTIEEMEAFQQDRSNDAYERIVDRYLGSPRFGERWAQIWLDLARYAETDGFEHDRVRTEAWQYRDWVIQSLNQDLPYDHFIFQQIAGDLNEDQPQPIATMFCFAGPDMPDINDQALRRHNRLNEITATIGSALLGLQLHCAQCHDHKVDPLSQADFYRLRAVFESSVPELKRDKPFNTFTSERATEPSRFYFRGDLQHAGPVIHAAFPRIAINSEQAIHYCETEDPRTEFADWLFQEDNPLTARVIVNRVWQSHFGRGLFDTPSDVGIAVAGPTHPELLDWLASELRRKDWSLKHLHRTIVLSSTYRQRSLASPNDQSWSSRIQIDPRNELYSRFPRHRLEAEVIRDSMLVIAGLLDYQTGGESVLPPLPEELVGTLLKGQWKTSQNESDHWRRSIYIFARRNLRYPILESFDRPEANESCAKRDLSTSAIQALQMLNSSLSYECSVRLCDRLLGDRTNVDGLNSTTSASSRSDKIDMLYRLALARQPTSDEKNVLLEFVGETESQFETSFLAACLAIMNTNEFIYID
jgi:Protein of unknown function (DUF1553)/Protein of unknown function (DUF1549)